VLTKIGVLAGNAEQTPEYSDGYFAGGGEGCALMADSLLLFPGARGMEISTTSLIFVEK